MSSYTLDEALDLFGIGKFQYFVIAVGGLAYVADSMEIMVLSFLGPIMKCKYHIGPEEESAMATSVFVGMCLGALVCGALSDRFGRKFGAIVTGLLVSVGGVLSAVVNSFGATLVARFIVGVGMGGVPVAYSWVMEFVPAKKRGRVGVIVQSFWTMGAIFQVTVSWITLKTIGYRWMLIITAVPIFVLLGMFFCVPESIRYLLAKGRYDRANRLLRHMAKVNKMQLPQGNLKVIKQNSDEFEPMSRKAKAICNNSYRHDTIMLMIMWVSNAAIYYGVVLLTTELIQINDDHAVTPKFNGTNGRMLLQQNVVESTDLQCSHLFTEQEFGELFLSAFSETPGMLLTFFLVDRIGRKKTQTFLFSVVTICFTLLYPILLRHLCCAPFLARAARRKF